MVRKRNAQAKQIKLSIKLRFKPNPEQAKGILKYLENYKHIFNVASKRISEIRSPWADIDAQINCDKCKIESPRNNKQNLRTGEKRCPKCYNYEFGNQFIRKLVLPSRRKSDITKPVDRILRLTPQKLDYYALVDHAINHYESFKEQIKQRKRVLKRFRLRLNRFEQILEGIGSPKVVEILPTGKKRVSRYQLRENFEKGFKRGYTLNELQNKVISLNEDIERKQKSLKRSATPQLKKLIAKLWQGKAKFDFSQESAPRLSLEIGGEKYEDMPIVVKDIVSETSRKRVEDALSTIKEEYFKNKEISEYAYFFAKPSRKNLSEREKTPSNYEFYLQYTFTPKIEEEYIPETVLGIDLGIKHPVVYSLEKLPTSPSQKPIEVKFDPRPENVRGADVIKKFLEKKNRRGNYLWRIAPRNRKGEGIKRKSNRLKSLRSITNYENWFFHNISKNLVNLAKSKKALIAMENLEGIRRRIRYTGKENRRVLSLFTQKKLRDLIKYKAKLAGVPFIEVPPAETSKRCYVCEKEGERPYEGNSELFHCKECNKTFNANYNASRNIAAKGFKIWSVHNKK